MKTELVCDKKDSFAGLLTKLIKMFVQPIATLNMPMHAFHLPVVYLSPSQSYFHLRQTDDCETKMNQFEVRIGEENIVFLSPLCECTTTCFGQL